MLPVVFAGVVYDVIDRRTETRDPAIANVDQMLLVMSLNLPPFDPQQATRFLVSSEAAEIPVTLLLNKADLLKDEETATVIEEVSVPHVVQSCRLPRNWLKHT